MAKIVEFAEVLTSEHTQYKAYAAGIKKTPPGVRLGDVLARTEGVYQVDQAFPELIQDMLRIAAEVSNDSALTAAADRGGAKISLEHLRGIDPNTRIVYGHRVSRTPEESAAITAKCPANLDPKNKIE